MNLKPFDMRPAVLSILMSALMAHCAWSQERVRVVGRVLAPNGWSLSDAHLMNVDAHEGVITDARGFFRMDITDEGALLRISHVAYHPELLNITQEMIEEEGGSPLQLTFTMTRRSTMLDAVDVVAQDHSVLFKRRGAVLFDIAFLDGDLLMLLAENGERKLVLKSQDMVRLAELSVGKKGESLYRDCLGHIHLFGNDSVYQVEFLDGELGLPYAFNRAYFTEKIADCAASTDSHIFFSSHLKAGHEVNHYGYHRETRTPILLRQLTDQYALRAMEDSYNVLRYNVFRHRMAASRWLGRFDMPLGYSYSPYDPLLSERGVRTDELWGRDRGRIVRRYMPGAVLARSFEEFLGSSSLKYALGRQKLGHNFMENDRFRVWNMFSEGPNYSPMFALRDSIYIFDHALGLCHVHASDGRAVRTFPIVHHEVREWSNRLIADHDSGRIYALMNRGPRSYLAEIDLADGSIVARTRLREAQNAPNLLVRNGYAYFLLETPDIREPSMLVRQRL